MPFTNQQKKTNRLKFDYVDRIYSFSGRFGSCAAAFMVLKLKISAFISLLITSIYVGILAGMPLDGILKSIQDGMGSTLGFVATVVGLGAIFGQMLESSGGAESLAHHLIKKFGQDKAPWAMVITGFIVAIPVFLDVGFIILVPIIYALSRDTKTLTVVLCYSATGRA
jgi:Gnt-I system low-affinity gluconate transporter